MKGLSAQEIGTYHRDGFVVPNYALSAVALASFQRLTKQLVEDNPTLLDKPMLCPHVPGSGVQGLKGRREWLQIATQPDVLDMIEQLIGPDIILWGTTMFYKRAKEGPPTPWHRDGYRIPIKPLATTTAWIAAFDSTIENGCLRCIPGSHIGKNTGYHDVSKKDGAMFRGELSPEEYDEGKACDVELKAGQMVIFDIYTIHGARPNGGKQPRAGYALRFMPATCHYDHGLAKTDPDEPEAALNTRPIMLVRGQDRTGKNDFSRGHPAVAAE